jgi:hypothetical protein
MCVANLISFGSRTLGGNSRQEPCRIHQVILYARVFERHHAIQKRKYEDENNHKRNEEILEELHVTPLEEKLCTYRHNWIQHVHRMDDYRLPKQLLSYHPQGRRRPGRPPKGLPDEVNAETGTGHPGLNS